MDTDESIRQYAGRNWRAGKTPDRNHWALRYRHSGGVENFLAAEALRQHMKVVQPEWPTAAQRALDLEYHIELKKQIDRAGRVITGS